jgi:hypothetical protein
MKGVTGIDVQELGGTAFPRATRSNHGSHLRTRHLHGVLR